jgi:hypothetical protein
MAGQRRGDEIAQALFHHSDGGLRRLGDIRLHPVTDRQRDELRARFGDAIAGMRESRGIASGRLRRDRREDQERGGEQDAPRATAR